MRLALRTAVPAVLVCTGALFFTSSAGAVGPCPDNYQPVPAAFSGKDKDRNGDGIVCAMGPQGSNGHFNYKDDNGNPAPGVQYDPLTGTYLQTSTGYAYWSVGNVWYDMSTVQDDLP